MSKKIQLSIAEPCHENWENMNPVEKGKFCGSCQKQVVDFSNMSDGQIAEFFKKPSTGSVCGRFMSDQLDREMEIPRKRIPFVKQFFQIALPAFLISAKASAQNITMGKMVAKPETKDTVKIPELRTLGLVAPRIKDNKLCTDTNKVTTKGEIFIVENHPIIGKVTDGNGMPVDNASIRINGTRNVIATKEDGTFSIVPASDWNKIVLVVSSIGFESKEILINRNDYQNNTTIDIGLVPVEYVLMGDVTVCKMEKKTEPKTLIPEIIKDATTKSFKVYPNPVIAGNSMNIKWIKKEEGYYILQLLNQSGQVVHRQEIWIDTEARSLSIDVPFISGDNYFLLFTNKKTGKKYADKLVVQ